MRRLSLRLHRWIGVAIALYVLAICVSGAVVVYRTELMQAFAPRTAIVEVGPRLLEDAEIRAAAEATHAGYRAVQVSRGKQPDHAAQVRLVRESGMMQRLVDPYTGRDLGNVLPLGYRFTSFMLSLHTDLTAGLTGRMINGALAGLFLVIGITGAIAWFKQPPVPKGAAAPGVGLLRLHRAVGIWSLVFVILWAFTGVHLGFPQLGAAIVDYFEPYNHEDPVQRVGDRVTYWMTYAHFGRFGGRIPGCDRETCDAVFKAIWATAALAPALLAATGTLLWWLRRRRKRRTPNALQNA